MLAIIIVILAVVSDQITKYFVVQAANPVNGISDWTQGFIPHVLSLSYAENKGGGFSILNDGGWQRVVLLGISLAAMALIVYILIKFYKRHPLMNIALSMILGGAIGNMIDRFRLGYVVDFLKTDFIKFPIFNVADCFVTVGAVLLAVYVIFLDAKVEARIKSESAPENPEEIATEEPVEEATEETVEETAEESVNATAEDVAENG